MRRAPLFTANVLTVAALAACSSSAETPKAEQHPTIQSVAATAIKITDRYPGAHEGKPPRSRDVQIPVEGGGELAVAVQTASDGEPDPQHPQEVGLTQTGVGDKTFSLVFLAVQDGKWNMSCTDHTGHVTELDHVRPAEMQSALDLGARVLDMVAGHESTGSVPASEDICEPVGP